MKPSFATRRKTVATLTFDLWARVVTDSRPDTG